MPDKPENQIPNPDELPEEELDLSEEPEQIWPPPNGPLSTAPPPQGLQAGAIDTGWSQEVRKIDEAIEEIRRINGHEPEVVGPVPGGAGEFLEREIAEIEEEMGAFGSGLAGDVDEEIDNEIAEVIKAESEAVSGREPPRPVRAEPARPALPAAAQPLPPQVEAAPPEESAPARMVPAPLAEPAEPEEPEEAIDLDTIGGEEEIEDLEDLKETEAPAPPSKRAAGEAAKATRSATTVDQLVAGVVETPRHAVEVAPARTTDAAFTVREKSEAELGQLWGNVFFSTDRAAPRGIIVTAARRRDGATQIAASLALVGAEASRERRVVLVDFNLRNPALADVLDIPGEPGVTEVLDGRCTLDAALHALKLKNGNELHVLPAGAPVDKPLGLLKSRQVQALISRLVERYDHTIIDVTAANAHPDPQVLGALVDGALLVIRAGETPRETVAEAKKRLDLGGVRCLGVVLNQRTDPIPGFVYRMT